MTRLTSLMLCLGLAAFAGCDKDDVDNAKKKLGQAGDKIKEGLKKLGGELKGYYAKAKEGTKGAMKESGEWLEEKYEKLEGYGEKVKDTDAYSEAKEAWGNLKEQVAKGADATKEGLKGAKEAAQEKWEALEKKAKEMKE